MKRKIANWLLKNLLNAVTTEDIVSNNPKTNELLIDGKPLTAIELKSLQMEIKALEGFRIWNLITNTVKSRAEKKIFNDSISFEDVYFGKAILYSISLQKSVIDKLKNKLH